MLSEMMTLALFSFINLKVMKAIITLREGINNKKGITKILEVMDYTINAGTSMLLFEVEEGNGVVPLKNIAGIYPIKENQN